ncbi:HAD hydrolase family protein [Eubacterium ventriosum]|uniref:HAD hydrolase family protein n=1 Tax=Eubacterium ventriosum TaxID=39496 RepID=UPI003C6D2F42
MKPDAADRDCTRTLHSRHEQVYAIGDAENDIDMLRATKHGYTFHHSPATVKQYAEGCVKSVSELIDKICNLD